MKKSLASCIEQYIKVLISRSELGQIEIQRIELAETFACVPSQISYVLNTRFSLSDGYIVESHRGGQGYVRITEIRKQGGAYDNNMVQFLEQLQENKLLNLRETEMLKNIVLSAAADLPAEYKIRFYKDMVSVLRNYLNIKTIT